MNSTEPRGGMLINSNCAGRELTRLEAKLSELYFAVRGDRDHAADVDVLTAGIEGDIGRLLDRAKLTPAWGRWRPGVGWAQ